MFKSSKQEFKEMAELIKAQSIQYQITLITLVSPIIAFIYGYKHFKLRFFIVATILSVVAYFISLIFLPWIAILKLNMIFCLAYLMGSYPFVIKKIWLYACKGYCALALLASPFYVLSSIPDDVINYLFSFVVVVLSQYLLWCGKRPVKLMKDIK